MCDGNEYYDLLKKKKHYYFKYQLINDRANFQLISLILLWNSLLSKHILYTTIDYNEKATITTVNHDGYDVRNY